MMKAYHGSEELKAATIAEMKKHQEDDLILQGSYWLAPGNDFSDDPPGGCAVGCMTHDPDGGHELFPEKWGIPEAIAFFEDIIFEGMYEQAALDWPVRFLESIPVGADLSQVADRMMLWLFTESPFRNARDEQVNEIVARLYLRRLSDDYVSGDEWDEALGRPVSFILPLMAVYACHFHGADHGGCVPEAAAAYAVRAAIKECDSLLYCGHGDAYKLAGDQLCLLMESAPILEDA